MSSVKSRFKIVYLTVLALCGLTALMATSAQANWLESGAEVTVNKNVKAKAHTTGKLIVEKLNFEIRCPTLTAVGFKLIAKSKEAEGKVKFTGCKGFEKSTGKEQKNCEPFTGTEKGVISVGVKALEVRLALIQGNAASLDEGWLYTILLPFAIEVPELCALTGTSEVKGSLFALCGELVSEKFVAENCSVSQKVHLLQPSGLTKLWKGLFHDELVEDEILDGKNAATLQGIASVELESGNSWSGDA